MVDLQHVMTRTLKHFN